MSNVKNFFGQLTQIRQWNWRAITFCLLLSTFVWFFNAFSKSYTTKIRYPIQFSLRRNDVVPLTPPSSVIDLEVSGLGWDLLRYAFNVGNEPVNISIDNPVRLKYLTSKALRPSIESKINGLQLQRIVEDTFFFNYDHYGSRRFAVVVDKKQIPLRKDFHVVSAVNVVPSKVVVKGAASVLRNLPDTLFVRFNDDDINENFSQNTFLDLPLNNFLKPETEKIFVSFKVSRFVQKTAKIFVKPLNFPSDSSLHLRENFATVRYLVAEENENLSPDSLRIFADFRAFSARDSSIMPRIYTPRVFTRIIISPAKFKVFYDKNKRKRK